MAHVGQSSATTLYREDQVGGCVADPDATIRAPRQTVDFGASDAPLLYRFADAPTDAASKNLFLGLRASIGVYRFEWSDSK